MRSLVPQSWRDPWWRGLDRERKKRIARAVRGGRAVDNPTDAPLAVKAARQMQRVEGRVASRRRLYVHLALVAIFLAVQIPRVHHRPSSVYVLVIAAAIYAWIFWLSTFVIVKRLAVRAHEAERLNRELAESYGIPLDPP